MPCWNTHGPSTMFLAPKIDILMVIGGYFYELCIVQWSIHIWHQAQWERSFLQDTIAESLLCTGSKSSENTWNVFNIKKLKYPSSYPWEWQGSRSFKWKLRRNLHFPRYAAEERTYHSWHLMIEQPNFLYHLKFNTRFPHNQCKAQICILWHLNHRSSVCMSGNDWMPSLQNPLSLSAALMLPGTKYQDTIFI